jgi:CTP synthase (UTP-ammonia lyase)
VEALSLATSNPHKYVNLTLDLIPHVTSTVVTAMIQNRRQNGQITVMKKILVIPIGNRPLKVESDGFACTANQRQECAGRMAFNSKSNHLDRGPEVLS